MMNKINTFDDSFKPKKRLAKQTVSEKEQMIEDIVEENGYDPEKFRLKTVDPPANHVLVRLIPQTEFKKGQIVITTATKINIMTPYAVILRKGRATGEYVDVMSDYNVGDLVLLQPGCGMKESDVLTDVNYGVLFITHLLGKFKNVLDFDNDLVNK